MGFREGKGQVGCWVCPAWVFPSRPPTTSFLPSCESIWCFKKKKSSGFTLLWDRDWKINLSQKLKFSQRENLMGLQESFRSIWAGLMQTMEVFLLPATAITTRPPLPIAAEQFLQRPSKMGCPEQHGPAQETTWDVGNQPPVMWSDLGMWISLSARGMFWSPCRLDTFLDHLCPSVSVPF